LIDVCLEVEIELQHAGEAFPADNPIAAVVM
jgi:hypothetical protein